MSVDDLWRLGYFTSSKNDTGYPSAKTAASFPALIIACNLGILEKEHNETAR